MERLEPVYRLGKIFNKHLIFEVFALAGSRVDVFDLIFGVNKQMRWLLLNNYKLALNILCQGKPNLQELILGKESHDQNFA